MDKIIMNSHAKINLMLDVLGKRDDGYHDIVTIMQQCGLCDSLLLEKRKEGIELKTNLPYLPVNEKNTAYKAAKMFFEHTGIDGGVYISVEKKIPVAAGLAGGSSNAAAVLEGLNKLYEANLSKETLLELGCRIGADVPYCIQGGTVLCEGIGEVMTPLKSLQKTCVVIIKPNISVSTAKIYEQMDCNTDMPHPSPDVMIKAIESGDTKALCDNLYNAMESVTVKMHPIIDEIKASLIKGGAMGSIMSGSGPSVFGFFDDFKKAKKAASKFKDSCFVYTGWTY